MAVGKKLRKRKTTAADLPEEVIQNEILTRLPIKSVVRFKSVSKSWLSLFSDPLFVKEHHRAAQNPEDYDCLIAQKNTRIAILSRYKETFLLPLANSFLIGSINGLVCLRNGKKLLLWNPAIHQFKELTIPPHKYSVLSNVGFGYNSASTDYKVVVLSVDKRSATLYCSSSNSWIDISVPDNVFPKDCNYQLTGPAIIAKDCPYWTFIRYSRFKVFIALKFDAGSNKFKLLPGLHIDGDLSRSCFEFVDMKDSLTLIMFQVKSSMVGLYSLDEEDGCCVWSKMYNVGPLNFHPLVSPTQGFKYGDELVFRYYGVFFCYDHETLTSKRLVGTSSTNIPPFVRCFRYMPSLVFLKGMKSAHSTTQTRRRGLCSRTPLRLLNSLRE
ncbi:putative F-box protein At1g47765 [Daucus carota subsp. sativus]|uniref:putative F-box protein At1g47765 n=1 Tax=Daucus carota subsp. sativus TaxID=79200 RepID=UPI0007EFB5A4|nr:PREDICTED: putative F-box protein At1g47765 [Daucus carota subsp. sativus]